MADSGKRTGDTHKNKVDHLKEEDDFSNWKAQKPSSTLTQMAINKVVQNLK